MIQKDVMTGSKSTWKLLKEEFDSTTINSIEYLGKIPYDSINEYIKRANVCVFPTYAETLGMVTIESMAMQKAVVNSDIGWAQELMEDGKSGFLVHPAKHEEFASKIIAILSNEKLSLLMGKEARKFVKNKFDSKKIVLQNIDFYKKIINDNCYP